MQAIMETIFDFAYLAAVITMGALMCVNSKQNRALRLFGIMALILGCGDAFHLLPRAYSLITGTMDENVAALGFGKLVTSVTMTVFYVILYHFFGLRYKNVVRTPLTVSVYVLAGARISLCLFPQNDWFSAEAPLSWGIYRNIPFVVLGVILICVSFTAARKNADRRFRNCWLAILLSFAFYVPVVLWADAVPPIGMLMIPKTLCYVWLVLMGFGEFRNPAASRGAAKKLRKND
ncbi:MAG: hypothetical protein LBN97_05565 [Oscillospiraceae bacterium]|jgi:hypothetical protein|nr:hypothetical protein [Oscillospiraceae bacterium]